MIFFVVVRAVVGRELDRVLAAFDVGRQLEVVRARRRPSTSTRFCATIAPRGDISSIVMPDRRSCSTSDRGRAQVGAEPDRLARLIQRLVGHHVAALRRGALEVVGDRRRRRTSLSFCRQLRGREPAIGLSSAVCVCGRRHRSQVFRRWGLRTGATAAVRRADRAGLTEGHGSPVATDRIRKRSSRCTRHRCRESPWVARVTVGRMLAAAIVAFARDARDRAGLAQRVGSCGRCAARRADRVRRRRRASGRCRARRARAVAAPARDRQHHDDGVVRGRARRVRAASRAGSSRARAARCAMRFASCSCSSAVTRRAAVERRRDPAVHAGRDRAAAQRLSEAQSASSCVPFAFAAFVAAGVAPLPTGNPMNLVVASAPGIRFNEYALHMIPVALVGWIVAYARSRGAFAMRSPTKLPRSADPARAVRLDSPCAHRARDDRGQHRRRIRCSPRSAQPPWIVATPAAFVCTRRGARGAALREISPRRQLGARAVRRSACSCSRPRSRAPASPTQLAHLYHRSPAPLPTVGIVAAIGSALINNHPMALLHSVALAGAPDRARLCGARRRRSRSAPIADRLARRPALAARAAHARHRGPARDVRPRRRRS